MAKKTSKTTREQMYREIIEKEGRKWEDCKVLSFAFKYQIVPLWIDGRKTRLFRVRLLGKIRQRRCPKRRTERGRYHFHCGEEWRRKDNPEFAIRWEQT